VESKVKAGIIEFATPKKDIKVQLQAALAVRTDELQGKEP